MIKRDSHKTDLRGLALDVADHALQDDKELAVVDDQGGGRLGVHVQLRRYTRQYNTAAPMASVASRPQQNKKVSVHWPRPRWGRAALARGSTYPILPCRCPSGAPTASPPSSPTAIVRMHMRQRAAASSSISRPPGRACRPSASLPAASLVSNRQPTAGRNPPFPCRTPPLPRPHLPPLRVAARHQLVEQLQLLGQRALLLGPRGAHHLLQPGRDHGVAVLGGLQGGWAGGGRGSQSRRHYCTCRLMQNGLYVACDCTFAWLCKATAAG